MNGKAWTVEDSAALYNLKGWGDKYFGVNAEGRLALHPSRDPKVAIDLKRVVDDVTSRGIELPVLFRFQDILRHRVERLSLAFKRAIEEHGYKGRYFGVYPIKVNQLREVVEEILDAGAPYQVGLEAGSKSELIAVLAMNSPECLTIVNGYKDETMMRLAMLGLKLGKQVIVVVEKPAEIDFLLKAAQEMGVRPLIGLRARLSAHGSGRWKGSAGEAAKFGLSTPELLAATRRLTEAGLAGQVKLLHFHIGSQVTDIQNLKDAAKEAARLYAKLKKRGLGLEYVDCGGGLGVDYDGSRTSADNSINYSLREYVGGVVYSLQEVCVQEGVPEPHIVTESGRALVAHHSVLVVDAFGAVSAEAEPAEPEPAAQEADVVAELRDILKDLTPKNLEEGYHDACQRRDEAGTLFKLGHLEIEDKAKAEELFKRICVEIRKLMPKAKRPSEELSELAASLHDQYLCNFSLFQSLPDSWAIGQVFPVMPLHRLDEEPTRRSVLVDLTCDSDGRIARFSCHKKTGGALPLHPLNGEPYHLGIFLMGAYQATMGDIHNLFGRVHEAHVFVDPDEPGGYYIEEVLPGQTVRDILADIQYSEFDLVQRVKSALDAQVKAGALKPREGVGLLDLYESVLKEYTYLAHRPGAAAPAPASAPAATAAI